MPCALTHIRVRYLHMMETCVIPREKKEITTANPPKPHTREAPDHQLELTPLPSDGARRDSLARRADKLEEEERARDDEDPIYGGIKGLGRDRRIRGVSVVVGGLASCAGIVMKMGILVRQAWWAHLHHDSRTRG